MNRGEFLKRARSLLDELERDHEECTGITASYTMDFADWMDELSNVHFNTVKR